MAAGLFPSPVPAAVRRADRGRTGGSRGDAAGARPGEPRLLARHPGASAASRPLSFVAKSEVARLAGGRRSSPGCSARVFIDRARRAAHGRGERGGRPAPRRGATSSCCSPEGTIGDGNRVLPFRSSLVGAARAALAERRAPGDPAAAARDHLYAAQRPAADPARAAGDRLVRRHGPRAAPRRLCSPAARSTARVTSGRADPASTPQRPQARDRRGRGGGAAGVSRGRHSGASRRAEPEPWTAR